MGFFKNLRNDEVLKELQYGVQVVFESDQERKAQVQ
jgi:hypothetical protein